MATLITLAVAFYGTITWWTSCILLATYAFLVLVVIVDDFITGSSEEEETDYVALKDPEFQISKEGKDGKELNSFPSS